MEQCKQAVALPQPPRAAKGIGCRSKSIAQVQLPLFYRQSSGLIDEDVLHVVSVGTSYSTGSIEESDATTVSDHRCMSVTGSGHISGLPVRSEVTKRYEQIRVSEPEAVTSQLRVSAKKENAVTTPAARRSCLSDHCQPAVRPSSHVRRQPQPRIN